MINDVAGHPSAFVTNDCITASVKYHDSSKLVCSGRAFNTKIQNTQMEGKLKGKKKAVALFNAVVPEIATKTTKIISKWLYFVILVCQVICKVQTVCNSRS